MFSNLSSACSCWFLVGPARCKQVHCHIYSCRFPFLLLIARSTASLMIHAEAVSSCFLTVTHVHLSSRPSSHDAGLFGSAESGAFNALCALSHLTDDLAAYMLGPSLPLQDERMLKGQSRIINDSRLFFCSTVPRQASPFFSDSRV